MNTPHLLSESTQFILSKTGISPTIGLILGSGLGAFADSLEDRLVLPYREIPHFPVSHVAGHAGNLVFGRLGPHQVAVMQGRVHYYEGHPMDTVVFPARVLVKLGCTRLVITNAAGGISPDLKPGDLALITDHLNQMGASPLRGPNFEELGVRFPDMTYLYDPKLREIATDAARHLGIPLKQGVYAAMPGPSYETPAEVRMLQTCGASMVGMSTVPEAIAAHHMGAKILGISCISNVAAGLSPTPLTHCEVQETADAIAAVFRSLVKEIVIRFPV